MKLVKNVRVTFFPILCDHEKKGAFRWGENYIDSGCVLCSRHVYCKVIAIEQNVH